MHQRSLANAPGSSRDDRPKEIARPPSVGTAPAESRAGTRYGWDNAWQQAHQRLAGLALHFDPGTIRLLDALGVGEGWRCLEVGAGGGSIAAWLCTRAGSSGRVVAIDIETRFLDALDRANLEVRRQDIVTDELPMNAFDLVHGRALLQHLAASEAALRRMVHALKPGGWLLVEEPDLISLVPDPSGHADATALFSRGIDALRETFRVLGSDASYGRRLYRQVRDMGLAEVGTEGRLSVTQGGSPEAEFLRLSSLQVREHVVASGLISTEEFDAYLALLQNPDVIWMEGTMIAVWGRRPQDEPRGQA